MFIGNLSRLLASKNLTKHYIITKFNASFLTMLLTIFTISSVIILIKVANMSSNVELNTIDFLKIYFYLLPTYLFYIVPIIFFISATSALSKMSLDSEMLVIFSFGLKLRALYFIYFQQAFMLSVFLLILSLGIVPVANHLEYTFLQEKRFSKSLNISETSDFGRKFGDWFIFVNKNSQNDFSNIILFKNDNAQEQIVIAKNAKLKEQMELELIDGKVFDIAAQEITEIDYEKMFINNSFTNKKQTYSSIVSYWERMDESAFIKETFLLHILISLFPILSIHAIIALGLLKPRISKNRTMLNALLFVLFFVFGAKIAVFKGLWHRVYCRYLVGIGVSAILFADQ